VLNLFPSLGCLHRQAFSIILKSSVHEFFLWWVFSRYDLTNYLPWLALNCSPPDLCLPRS
jgi:hypothetical protein